MSDTILKMPDGSQWRPSSSKDSVYCASCNNAVDTPEEILSYPEGNCPQCGESWTGNEKRSTTITVTAPEPISSSTL